MALDTRATPIWSMAQIESLVGVRELHFIALCAVPQSQEDVSATSRIAPFSGFA